MKGLRVPAVPLLCMCPLCWDPFLVYAYFMQL